MLSTYRRTAKTWTEARKTEPLHLTRRNGYASVVHAEADDSQLSTDNSQYNGALRADNTTMEKGNFQRNRGKDTKKNTGGDRQQVQTP